MSKHKLPNGFNLEELRKGCEVEMEHTDDHKEACEIALDHLWEDPKYYTKLATIHREKNPSQTYLWVCVACESETPNLRIVHARTALNHCAICKVYTALFKTIEV